MPLRTRNKFISIAAAALLTAGTVAAAPVPSSPIVIETSAAVTFINNCVYPVGVTIAADWHENRDAPVWPLDAVFVIGPGEHESVRMQPRTADGELFAVMYYIQSTGMGSDIFKEGVLPQTFAAQLWFACGTPSLVS